MMEEREAELTRSATDRSPKREQSHGNGTRRAKEQFAAQRQALKARRSPLNSKGSTNIWPTARITTPGMTAGCAAMAHALAVAGTPSALNRRARLKSLDYSGDEPDRNPFRASRGMDKV
jgi:hypothetical protein